MELVFNMVGIFKIHKNLEMKMSEIKIFFGKHFL